MLLAAALICFTFAAPPSHAGFAEGLAAYDAGDLRAAYAQWRPLAEAGNVQAQTALAGLLESGGPGLRRDLVTAALWYRRAARAGDPVAQMNLGELYRSGRGVPRDQVRALAWFTLAAEQGREWAAEQRRLLWPRLSVSDRRAALILADLLRANH